MVNLTIDGKNVSVPEGTTILQAAREAGIEIPTLCDHPELEPYGGCRLCLVEVEGARGMQTSCTLPAGNNMVVKTDTEKLRKAREFVLTLLFSERNHFCMFCQVSGGDCELQNAAYAEGMTHWPIPPAWAKFPVDASHPYFVMDNNRCILCRRCVRACSDLVGNHTLSMENRGAKTLLIADVGIPWGESTCISCGTCVQVCPTGALIPRGSSYLGHNAQTTRTKSICVGCSVGCSTEVVTRDNHLVAIEGDWAGPVNGGLLCEYGRLKAMSDARERITTPLVRKDGALQPVSWDEALEALAAGIKAAGKDIAALASTRLPAEALYAFKKLFADGLGGKLVSSLEEGYPTVRAAQLADELGQPFEGKLAALDTADCVVVVGADLAGKHQVAGFFVKRALQKGLKMIVIDSNENALDALTEFVLKPSKKAEAATLSALLPGADIEAAAKASGVTVRDLQKAVAALEAAQQPVFVYGRSLAGEASGEALTALSALVKRLTEAGKDASMLSVKGKANSMAAAQLKLEAPFEANGHKAAYLALGDDDVSERMLKSFAGIPFLAVQASHASALTEKADVVLPVEMWAEAEGHYLNLDGRLQAAQRALIAPAGVRSNAGALAALAAKLGIAMDESWMDGLLERVPSVAIER